MRVRARHAKCHITIILSDTIKQHMVEVGYDPNYGARPLKRAITKEIETPLGRLILEGKVKDGQEVRVEKGEQGLEFKG